MHYFKSLPIFIICILIASGCTSSKKPEISLEKNKIEKFDHIAGTIKISIIDSRYDKKEVYSLIKGQINLEQSLPFPPNYLGKKQAISFFQNNFTENFQQVESYRYHGPYDFNKEKTKVSVTLASESPDKSTVPSILAVIDTANNKIIYKSPEGLHFYIDDISWSPDSKMFAVLEHQSKHIFTIFGLVGHPVYESTLFISIYDNNGKLLVRSKIAHPVYEGGWELDWTT